MKTIKKVIEINPQHAKMSIIITGSAEDDIFCDRATDDEIASKAIEKLHSWGIREAMDQDVINRSAVLDALTFSCNVGEEPTLEEYIKMVTKRIKNL